MILVMRKQWSKGSGNEELDPPPLREALTAQKRAAPRQHGRVHGRSATVATHAGLQSHKATLWRHLGVLVSLQMEINNKRWESISWKKKHFGGLVSIRKRSKFHCFCMKVK